MLIYDWWWMNEESVRIKIILHKSLCNYQRSLQIISQQLWCGIPGTKQSVLRKYIGSILMSSWLCRLKVIVIKTASQLVRLKGQLTLFTSVNDKIIIWRYRADVSHTNFSSISYQFCFAPTRLGETENNKQLYHLLDYPIFFFIIHLSLNQIIFTTWLFNIV